MKQRRERYLLYSHCTYPHPTPKMFMKRRLTRPVVGSAQNRRRRPRRRRRCGIADFFNKAKIFKRSLPEDDDFLDDEAAVLGDFDKLAIDVADYAEIEGRDGSDSCEIHINSDYIVGAIGLLAAGLAYITYVAITQGRRRKKRRSTEGTVSIGDSALTAVLLGMALVHMDRFTYLFSYLERLNILVTRRSYVALRYNTSRYMCNLLLHTNDYIQVAKHVR